MDAKAKVTGALLLWTLSINAQPQKPQDSGQSITGAYEGWFRNGDGSFSILLGYFNRNLKQEVDVPVGVNNRIEPGGPDRGQPEHFLPRRQWGVFIVNVPKDFGTRKLTWTLAVNGQTNSIPFGLDPLWEISPFREEGVGNTPPVLRFDPKGPPIQGPIAAHAQFQTKVGDALPLTVWANDDAKAVSGFKPLTPPITLTWTKYRGPGSVAFSTPKPRVDASAKATTEAVFSEPGEYVLLLVANDWSGEGGRGFLCCWTTAHAMVSVQSKDPK